MINELIELLTQQGIDEDFIKAELTEDALIKVLIEMFDIDSLDQIELVINIEDKYDIEITDDELSTVPDMSVVEFIDFIKTKQS